MPSGKIKYSFSSTFDNLSKRMDVLSNDVIAKGADRILGSFGSESRKILGAEAEKELTIGSPQEKYYKRQLLSRTAVKDHSHGWYKSETGRKIIGFGYEKTAYRRTTGKYLKRYSAVSTGYVYSLLYNLWGKPVTYKKRSPLFRRGGEGSWGAWRPGSTREARIKSFTISNVNSAIPSTLARADKDLNELLRQEGF